MKTTTLLNPFVVGRYVSDYYFCDREKETEFLTKQIMQKCRTDFSTAHGEDRTDKALFQQRKDKK